MLERIGQQIYKIFLAGIVLLLSVVFTLQFGGPQAEGCNLTGPTYAAKVYGTVISEGDFDANYSLAGFDRHPREVQERNEFRVHTLNGLIERSLLAEEARQLGFSVSQDEVMDKLAADGTVYLSMGVDAPPNMPSGEMPVGVRDENGNFDQELARRFIQYGLRRSLEEFAENQILEQLADRMRQTVTSSVEVSPSEVWDAFVRERDTAKVKYLRFSPLYYRDFVEPTDEELAAWIAANSERMDTEYEANQHRFENLEKQVRSRHILVRLEAGASEDVQTAARTRAAALLERVRAGDDFNMLARRYSDDNRTARSGGDLGWGAEGAQVRPLDEAQFAMEVGEVSELVESRYGIHIVKVVGIREGNVAEEDARRELAMPLYQQEQGEAMARTAAEEALASLRNGSDFESIAERLAAAAEGRGEEPAERSEEEGVEPEEDPLRSNREPDALLPSLRETRDFGRGDVPIDGVDNSELVRIAFELTDEDPVPEEILEMGSDLVVFRLESRSRAERDEFTDEVRQRLLDGLSRAKQREALALYIHSLRGKAADEIQVNESILRYDRDDPGVDEEEPEEEE
ncbi:MAG: peptidylprolyl isomerase [Myxococcota bacterium]